MTDPLVRTVSTATHTVLTALASECVCPISQALMVDPVLAADGHSYDRSQIESWFRQQESEGHDPPTSPQTREPLQDTRLVPNLALRRTIERLIESESLDKTIVEEWHTAKQELLKQTANSVREKSLANAPIGSDVHLRVKLEPPSECSLDEDFDFPITVHAAVFGHGGGLFGGPASFTPGRMLLEKLSVRRVLRAHCRCSERSAAAEQGVHIVTHVEEAVKNFLAQRVKSSLPPAPLPKDELISTVFGEAYDSGGQVDGMFLALSHVVRRLASTPGGMPDDVRAEWEILDRELGRRRLLSAFRALLEALSSSAFRLSAVVEQVDDKGNFTLAFPCLDDANASAEPVDLELNPSAGDCISPPPLHLTVQVPADFIGPGGVVLGGPGDDVPFDGARPLWSGRGLFGPPAPSGGLFGSSPS